MGQKQLNWSYINAHAGIYEVSACGKVRSISRYVPAGKAVRRVEGKILSLTLSEMGYYCVKLKERDGVRKHHFLHRLVAEAFIPNPENLPIVGHRDNNKRNCHKDNLYWTTQSQNVQDAWDSGLRKRKSIAKKIMKKRNGR